MILASLIVVAAVANLNLSVANLHGAGRTQVGTWANSAGAIAVALDAVLVFFGFPKHEAEMRLLDRYPGPKTRSTAWRLQPIALRSNR